MHAKVINIDPEILGGTPVLTVQEFRSKTFLIIWKPERLLMLFFRTLIPFHGTGA